MGRVYLTGKRLVLYHPSFAEVLFETPLEGIKGLAMEIEEKHFTGKERETNGGCFPLSPNCTLNSVDPLR